MCLSTTSILRPACVYACVCVYARERMYVYVCVCVYETKREGEMLARSMYVDTHVSLCTYKYASLCIYHV